jgi:hypothetical protein
VCSIEVNRFTKCTFFLPHIIVLDVNLLKIILTSIFFAVNCFAYVALVNQKHFFKRFPEVELSQLTKKSSSR